MLTVSELWTRTCCACMYVMSFYNVDLYEDLDCENKEVVKSVDKYVAIWPKVVN